MVLSLRVLRIIAFRKSFRKTLLTIRSISRFMGIAGMVMLLTMYSFAVVGTDVFGDKLSGGLPGGGGGGPAPAALAVPASYDALFNAGVARAAALVTSGADRARIEALMRPVAPSLYLGSAASPGGSGAGGGGSGSNSQPSFFDSHISFDNFGAAMLWLFQMTTTSNWQNIMYTCVAVTGTLRLCPRARVCAAHTSPPSRVSQESIFLQSILLGFIFSLSFFC